MFNINREKIKQLKQEYPEGTIVELIYMNDPQAPLPGTHGTVKFIDDAGTVHISWEDGSSLGALYGKDKIKIV